LPLPFLQLLGVSDGRLVGNGSSARGVSLTASEGMLQEKKERKRKKKTPTLFKTTWLNALSNP